MWKWTLKDLKSEWEDWKANIQPSCLLCFVLGPKRCFFIQSKNCNERLTIEKGFFGDVKGWRKKTVMVPYAWEQRGLMYSLRWYVLKYVFWVVFWGRVYISEMQLSALGSLLLLKGSKLLQVWDFQSPESSSHWLLVSASSIKYVSKDKSTECHHLSLCGTLSKTSILLLPCILWTLACHNVPQ